MTGEEISLRDSLANPVLSRFGHFCALDDLGLSLLAHPTGEVQVRQGGALTRTGWPRAPRFVLSGWAARTETLPDGRRQILAFYLPGDSLEVYKRAHPLSAGQVVALTPMVTMDATQVEAAIRDGFSPSLACGMRVSACLVEAHLLNQTFRLGRLTAYERICHLFLEFHERLSLTGMVSGAAFPFPLSQEIIGEATAMSTVHANRMVQELRRDGLLDFRGGLAILPDLPRARQACNFKPHDPQRWAQAAHDHHPELDHQIGS